MADMLIEGETPEVGFTTMFWWIKSQLTSPDGSTRQKAIKKLCALLEHGSEVQQQKSATLLATVGHPSAVRYALQHVANRDSAEFAVRVLERIISDFANAVETDSLERLATLADPWQKVTTPPMTVGGRQLPANWENYRALDCSALRQKAEAELLRRAEAEAKWLAADEQEKLQRQAPIPALVERRTA